MQKLSLLAASVASLCFANAANAAVEIKADPSFVQPEENVQLDTDLAPGDNVLRGTTNQTDSKVLFDSSTDNLAAPPQGQARIEPTGAGAEDGLGELTFSLENGGTFTSAEFNILASVGGLVTLSALDSANMIIESIMPTVGISGQNFFGFLADASTPISSIQITAAPGTRISSISQVRVGGVSAATPGAVPEPATWAMMLFGFGAVGFGMRRRRSKEKVRVRYNFA
ncbi:PEPxxWA-CTERM sorting domain-containing protein [Parafrankia sp. BMG5.11]|uniref:PEPxxWA-CTERM sorting domain-containing protein n=1 Tax=Parafrankia sp. BMG5.11 TaxID=222540 RepID=UPI001A9F91B3|nr:PEPxxWA-CTERM sorting domain-containing protein [Parafrankia sp. BMG5.11]